jgi:hypothetical protein
MVMASYVRKPRYWLKNVRAQTDHVTISLRPCDLANIAFQPKNGDCIGILTDLTLVFDPRTKHRKVATSQSNSDVVALRCWGFGLKTAIVSAVGWISCDVERRLLVEWVRRQGRPVTVRQLQRHAPKRYPTSDDARATLDAIVETGFGVWGISSTASTGGHQKRTLTLVDTSTVDTCPGSGVENAASVNCQPVNGFDSTTDEPEFRGD